MAALPVDAEPCPLQPAVLHRNHCVHTLCDPACAELPGGGVTASSFARMYKEGGAWKNVQCMMQFPVPDVVRSFREFVEEHREELNQLDIELLPCHSEKTTAERQPVYEAGSNMMKVVAKVVGPDAGSLPGAEPQCIINQPSSEDGNKAADVAYVGYHVVSWGVGSWLQDGCQSMGGVMYFYNVCCLAQICLGWVHTVNLGFNFGFNFGLNLGS